MSRRFSQESTDLDSDCACNEDIFEDMGNSRYLYLNTVGNQLSPWYSSQIQCLVVLKPHGRNEAAPVS